MSLEDILKGCQKYDRMGQALLYRHFYGYAMSVCVRYAGNREEAVEILNDGFMKIFKTIKKFDLHRPFKPWLRAILVNTAINHYKRSQRVLQFDTIEEEEVKPDEEILSTISYKEILELLSKLPPSYRTVFNLFAIEGYKHEEIAKMLNITVGGSKSLLAAARRQLKKHLLIFFEVSYA